MHEAIVQHETVTASIDAQKGRVTPIKRSTNKDIRVAFGWNRTPAKYPTNSKQQLRWDRGGCSHGLWLQHAAWHEACQVR
jgi:hypothetical protein